MAGEIKILLVDDIAEVRENVRKLLTFEQDFQVIGSTGSGRDGIKLAKELRPDVIIMDINMPDIDGIQATKEIRDSVPTAAVIMMSVNSDADYMRRAMMAGASNFLTKPANMDELYNTIRTVYKATEAARRQARMIEEGAFEAMRQPEKTESEGDRAGNVIVVYSPKGGAGTTTVATNMASSLMREGTKVLLVDADVQFGDVGVFLNISAQSTLADLIEDAADMDAELFENIVATHGSGLKVLLGPKRPELAETIWTVPSVPAEIISKIRNHYDYVIVDTSSRLDEMNIQLCDIATKIMLVSTPTLPSIKSIRFVMDLFDQLYEPERILMVLNQVHDERQRTKMTIPRDAITKHLKREIFMSIPSDEKPILQAIIKGVPVVAAERNKSTSPVKELIDLAEKIRIELGGVDETDEDAEAETSASGLRGLFGSR